MRRRQQERSALSSGVLAALDSAEAQASTVLCSVPRSTRQKLLVAMQTYSRALAIGLAST